VETFCAVTSATPAEASFFLEGHNWALESAIRSFYDSSEVDADGPDLAPQPPPPATDDEGEDYVGGDKDEEDALVFLYDFLLIAIQRKFHLVLDVFSARFFIYSNSGKTSYMYCCIVRFLLGKNKTLFYFVFFVYVVYRNKW
jgi:hypothetical protein